MSDLASWLLEQIAEDERQFAADPQMDEWALTQAGDYNERYIVGLHIRLRAECEAKRKIIALHHERGGYTTATLSVTGECAMCLEAAYPECLIMCDYPCETLRLLALPYTDRPGYREEWRP